MLYATRASTSLSKVKPWLIHSSVTICTYKRIMFNRVV